ncbi:RNA-binding domain-containing protein [uncultured Phascolarctobacterium sp.]|uniref:RNA-binding domain-containing protein n=1 Tax=uncultured Phascolarctobacterium sp. TaxID=512296 RepID=UPI0025E7EB11|nr:RNA-binding domain-containing protein [uncultured Phascolarctobacterium sp.]
MELVAQRIYKKILPLIEGHTEGIYWDFKRTLCDTSEIIKDVLAFSNSAYPGDSYIIVGVGESSNRRRHKISLCTKDRQRLGTDANYIYLPQKWDLHGLSAKDIEKMQVFSQTLTQKVRNAMLISQPTLEYIPIQIKRTRWIYVIVVKKVHGVFISKKDLKNNNGKTVVKQGVLYVRSADTTAGSDESNVTSADEHIRVWMDYINYLSINPNGKFRLVFNNEPKIGDQKNESTWPID